jgi:hypothetical protein
MGLTERLGDGTVVSSNVYGLSNAFSFGPGALRGFAMFGDRRVENGQDMFGLRTPTAQVEEGKGKAIVQDLDFAALGGKLQASYQESDDRFAGYQALREAGMDEARALQLSNERGLKRTSLSASGIGGPSLALGAAFRQVGDDQGAVTWREYSGRLLGAHVKYEATKVDPGFTRFQSIAEADRDQLAKERGLVRQKLSLERTLPGGSLGFESSRVEDGNATGVYRRGGKLETPFLKLRFSDQHVQQGFTRFGDMREADRDQLAREAGIVRQSEGLELTPRKGVRLAYDGSELRTGAGDFVAQDAKLELGRVTLEHGRREVGPGFAALGNLPGNEVQAHVARAAHMLEPGLAPRDEDYHSWGGWAGVSRSFGRLGVDFGKGASLLADRYDVDGSTDGLDVTRLRFTSGLANFSYREQRTGGQFSEIGRLSRSELERLGTIVGFSRTDFAGSLAWGGRTAEYSRTSMGDALGGAERVAYALNVGFATLRHTRRSVDPTFVGVVATADPERDRLAGLIGFDESHSEATLAIGAVSGQAADQRSENRLTGEVRSFTNAATQWAIDRLTRILFSRSESKVSTPNGALVDQRHQALGLSRDFGKLGKLSFAEEKHEFDGINEPQPDSTTQRLAYEKQVDPTLSLRTEHARTRYENGEQETSTTNAVSKAITPRVGVSVSDTQVRRDGDRPDETHRDYGFWVDFGKGIRLNYKAKRDLVGEAQGTQEHDLQVSPGEAQGVKIGSAAYQRYGWDDQRDRHVGNVNVSNAKPLDWGWLKDVRFHYTVDSVRDYDLWQRENRSMGFGARLNSFAFGYDYRLQTLPTGDRAIDRQFSFTTDVTGKGWLRGDVRYNLRTLPMGQQVMVRNFSITAEPVKGWTLTHSVLANPLQADGNVILGEFAQPTRSNKWGLLYSGDPGTKLQATWEEFLNEQTGLEVAAARIGVTMFADNPSPLHLEYVLAQTNEAGEKRRSHGFNIRFDQRAGPNQSLAFRLGNTNWELARPGDQKHQNWTLRLDYSVRF